MGKLRPRVIATLLLSGRSAVKTTNFKNPRYLGDPINIVKIFNDKGVDELAVIDVSTDQAGEPDFQFLGDLAAEAFMPLTYGGKIRSASAAARVFESGIEKVLIGKMLYDQSDEVQQVVQRFGSQAVAGAVDVRNSAFNKKLVWNREAGRSQLSPVDWARHVESLGVGEILLSSVALEGTRRGYDLDLVSKVSDSVSIPVVANGGAGCVADFKAAVDFGASAVAAGSMFCFTGRYDAVLVNYPSEEELADAFR